jgi:hypothetical protein
LEGKAALDVAERCFTSVRLSRCKQVTSTPSEAVELYKWDADLSAAFWIDLGHLEVALRNAMSRQLQQRHSTLKLPGSWLDDPTGELGRDLSGEGKHKHPYLKIVEARGRVAENHKDVTAAQIVSETSFGLWHQLMSAKQTNLWPDLARVFPHAPNRRRETVADPVGRLRDLRNRIGHHHQIWTHKCQDRHGDLLLVCEYLDEDLRKWVEEVSLVPQLLCEPPAGVAEWQRRAS